MDGALPEVFRHLNWANVALLDYCARLDTESLDMGSPGTYGSIRETLHHLVAAEEGYCNRVTGERPAEALGDSPAPLEELRGRMATLGPRWESVLANPTVAGNEFMTGDGWIVAGVVVMVQAIHHAAEHRGHVLSILGARGLPVPDLSMWAYGQSRGLLRIDPNRRYAARVRTTRGDFTIQLTDSAAADKSVNRFVYLARDEFYDGLPFHRVMPGRLVQGGDGMREGAVLPSLGPAGVGPGAWPRGSVGLASRGDLKSGSQFFVTLSDGVLLGSTETYAQIGEVSSGLDVVEAIESGDVIESVEISAL